MSSKLGENKFILSEQESNVHNIEDAIKIANIIGKQITQHYSSQQVHYEQNLLEKYYLSTSKKIFNTTFFSIDIRGFTPLSHKKSSSDLSKVIESFSVGLSRIIYENGGQVLKYVGDAVLSFYPTKEIEKSIERALLTAVTTQIYMDKHFLPYLQENDIRTSYGIGLDAGEVSIMKVGSPGTKLDYDLIGKPINVSVKLQAMAENGEIIIGETIYENMPAEFKSYVNEYTAYSKHPSGFSRSILDKILHFRRDKPEKIFKFVYPK